MVLLLMISVSLPWGPPLLMPPPAPLAELPLKVLLLIVTVVNARPSAMLEDTAAGVGRVAVKSAVVDRQRVGGAET